MKIYTFIDAIRKIGSKQKAGLLIKYYNEYSTLIILIFYVIKHIYVGIRALNIRTCSNTSDRLRTSHDFCIFKFLKNI